MASTVVTRPHFLGCRVGDPAAEVWRRAARVPLLLWTVRTPAQLDTAERQGANAIFEGIRPPVVTA